LVLATSGEQTLTRDAHPTPEADIVEPPRGLSADALNAVRQALMERGFYVFDKPPDEASNDDTPEPT
jgi:hypothetical protein